VCSTKLLGNAGFRGVSVPLGLLEKEKAVSFAGLAQRPSAISASVTPSAQHTRRGLRVVWGCARVAGALVYAFWKAAAAAFAFLHHGPAGLRLLDSPQCTSVGAPAKIGAPANKEVAGEKCPASRSCPLAEYCSADGLPRGRNRARRGSPGNCPVPARAAVSHASILLPRRLASEGPGRSPDGTGRSPEGPSRKSYNERERTIGWV